MKTRPMAMVQIAVLALLAALPVQAAAQAQPTVDLADDLADVAGILVYDTSSRKGMLHVLPGEEQKVLAVLGGSPIGGDKYLVNPGGPPVIVGISPDFFRIYDWISADEQVWVYNNRVCKEIAPAQINFCQPNGNGQYTTLLQLPNHVCQRDSYSMGNYCAEHKRIWSTRDVWKDDQCTILDHRDTVERFTCGN